MFKIYNITEKDLKKVSEFIKDNFLNFPPYKDVLTKQEMEWFFFLNTPEKLKKKLDDENYIYTKLIKDENDKVMWICFAELEDIELEWEKVSTLCIKRMHWHRDFIEEGSYNILYFDIENFVKNYNKNNENKIKYLTVVPSNSFIKNFFLEKWFKKIKEHLTDSMKENNIPATDLLWKSF